MKFDARHSILLKTSAEIEAMRAAGRVVAEVLRECEAACRPGVTTRELDDLAFETFTHYGAIGLFKGYPDYLPEGGYPRHTCISINEEIVHGIPGDRIVREGDLVTMDCGVRLEGWCADSARTFLIGRVPPEGRRLVETTRALLEAAIERIRPGRRWSEVARVMQDMAEKGDYGIVREYVGHGIGRSMHEAPKVPNFVSRQFLHEDFSLQPGMVLAIEPMLTLGCGQTMVLRDGWTVVTRDRTPAAHEEHTVAVTRSGADVLTRG